MKKILVLIAIVSTSFLACNDPKDPPDDQIMKIVQAHADSLKKVDSLEASLSETK